MSQASGLDSGVLPEKGGRWRLDLTAEDGGRLVGLFLDSLREVREGRTVPSRTQAAEPSGPPVFVTVYQDPLPVRRIGAREETLEAGVQQAAGSVIEALGTRVAPERVRVRVDVVSKMRPFGVDERVAFARETMGKPCGLALKTRGGQWRLLLPADMLRSDIETNLDMLHAMCRRAGLPRDAWQSPEVELWRLDVTGFVNDAPGGRRALASERGLASLGEPDVAMIERSCRMAAGYLLTTQEEDGSFPMFWDPATGLQGGCESLVLDLAAVGALSAFCEFRPDASSLKACHRALSYGLRFTNMDERRPRMGFTSAEEVCHKAWELEETAQLLEGICRYRHAGGRQETEGWLGALAEFLLHMQREDGRFEVRYDPKSGERSTPPRGFDPVVAQARAATALALARRELQEDRFLAGAHRALEALSGERAPLSAERARWVMTAMAELDAVLGENPYSDWAADVAGQRREAQIGEGQALAADLVGGTLASYPPTAAETADDLIVFATAAAMGLGEENLAAAERAARFLVESQFLPENSYYLPQPEGPAGGFRNGPASNVIRIQSMDSALRGMVLLTRLMLREQTDD